MRVFASEAFDMGSNQSLLRFVFGIRSRAPSSLKLPRSATQRSPESDTYKSPVGRNEQEKSRRSMKRGAKDTTSTAIGSVAASVTNFRVDDVVRLYGALSNC